MKIVSQSFRELQMCKAICMLTLKSGVREFEAILYDEGPEFLF